MDRFQNSDSSGEKSTYYDSTYKSLENINQSTVTENRWDQEG